MENETERIEHHFRQLTGRFLSEAERKLTLARARGDAEGVVREHVKIEVMRAAAGMFEGARNLARRERAGVLLVTHDEQLAARANRTLHLLDGRIEEAGKRTVPEPA